jgi:hypothetical protein
VFHDLQQKSSRIDKEYEVTDKLEYIQYLSTLDKKIPRDGGRNNDWRELNPSSFKDQNIIYDNLRTFESGGKQPRALDKAYNLIKKHKKKYNSVDLLDTGEKDEDFEMLIDWADHLDEANLFDYDLLM